MIIEKTRWQLAPGAHAVPEGADGLLLTTPDEEIARVHLPAGDRDLLLDVLSGRTAPGEALRAANDADQLAEVFDGCAEEGIAGPTPVSVPTLGGTVAVSGDNPLADALRQTLSCAGFDVARAGRGHADLGSEVLVACAGWLPDQLWQQIDDQRTATGRPWHRCYVEGTRLVVGPFSVPGHGPSYRDTRIRRLAASAWPDELEQLWQHLGTAAALPQVPWPDAGVLAVAAGLITADLVAHRAGRTAPGIRRQVVIDPADLSWRAHPVLAIPTGMMRTATP